jgi:putative colanic acid biosynthesis UDP-glucose lipid carrier transferase
MLPRGLLKEHSRLIAFFVCMMDAMMVGMAGIVAYLIKFNNISMPFTYQIALVSGALLAPPLFSFFGIYESLRGKSILNHLMQVIQAMLGVTLLLAGLAFLTKSGETYSRVWFLLWMVMAVPLLVLIRYTVLCFLRLMRARGFNERRVIIVGANELGMKLAQTMQEAIWTGFRVVAFLDDYAKHPTTSVQRIPVIPTPTLLAQYLRDEVIDEIWLALPLREEARVKEILFEIRHLTVTIRLIIDVFGLDLLNHSITDMAGFPVLNIRSSPMVGVNRLIKGIEDRSLAVIMLLLTSPLFLLIALCIKMTSRGPVFFKQARLGFDGRTITVYKFRTMVMHREEGGQVTQATVHDKRVTSFGRLLRRTSLDELPQLINVLQGRMSIVGPRPHALAHNELYKDTVRAYMHRHHVKPGITGWAQVNGWRGETDTLSKMQKRVEYDLFYINNWSLGFDLKILFLTVIRGLIHRNAY